MKNLLIGFVALFCLNLFVIAQSDNNRAFYYENGKKKSEGHVNDANERIGLWTFYFENGAKKSVGIFQDGLKFGEWKTFYSSGTMKSKGSLVIKEGESIKNGLWTWYHNNAVKKMEGAYKIGRKVGYWTEWDKLEIQLSKKKF